MGLIIEEVLPNGVPLSYFRIVSLTTVVNNSCIIEVAGYTSQDKRAEEQASIADPEANPCDVYIDSRYISVDYDPDMSVNKAYALLKGMEEFADAEDVIDKWATGTAYYTGDLVMDGEQEYECIQPHTSQEGWEPPNAPALWKKHSSGGEVPEWVQPTGAQDAYAKGDKVTHNGKTWTSDVDGNVWEPGVYGWSEGGE